MHKTVKRGTSTARNEGKENKNKIHLQLYVAGQTPRSVAARRNIKVSALQARRRDGDAEAAATE